MKKEWIVKTLALGVVVLFISFSFQPVFANESNEKITDSKTINDEKIEYTIQIIKTNKVIENKVYLTKQQADELENLIENIHNDLNNFESQEETEEVYNNAINSFNNLGLFPENITIDEIKQLVYGETQNLDSIKFKDETLTEFDNILCHVTGESSYTIFFAPALLLLASAVCFPEGFFLASLLSFFKYHESLSLFFFLLLLSILFAVPAAILFLISLSSILSILPVAIGGICSLGEIFSGYETEYRPASGWISTMGLNGKKNYTGEFYGHLGWNFLICPGIVGFTGLHIFRPTTGNVFYFGSALRVGISTEPY